MYFWDTSLNCIQHIFFIWIKYQYWSFVLHSVSFLSYKLYVHGKFNQLKHICWWCRHMIKKKSKESFIAFKEALKYKYYYSPWFDYTFMRMPGPLFANTLSIVLLCLKRIFLTDETAGRCGRTTAMLLWMLAISVR